MNEIIDGDGYLSCGCLASNRDHSFCQDIREHDAVMAEYRAEYEGETDCPVGCCCIFCVPGC